MAHGSKKISALDPNTVADIEAEIPIVQNGTTYRYKPALSYNVVAFGASPSASAAVNTAAINTATVAANAAGGGIVYIPPGTYSIASTLTMLSNVTLQGAGIGKTILYMPGANFTNTTTGSFSATSVAIDCSGQTSSPFTANTKIALLDFTIESQTTDGRYLYPILARNVQNLHIARVEIFGVPAGILIALDSITKRSVVEHCYLHDCTTAVTSYTGTPQTTGVETDNNRVNSIESVGLDIHDNRIEDLTFTGSALTTYGFQTDGVNLGSATESVGITVHDNYIRNVGEGIDTFSSDNDIHDNQLIDCYIAGLKLIHGASRNQLHHNTILRPGLAGILLGGSSTTATTDNVVSDNRIHDVNPTNAWDVASYATAGIRIDSGGTASVDYNTFARNKVTGGAVNMRHAIRQDQGTDNRYYDNEARVWATSYSSIAGGTAKVTNIDDDLEISSGLLNAQAGEFRTTGFLSVGTSPAASGLIRLGTGDIIWALAAVTPRIYQADDTANSATGDIFTLRAQSCTGTTSTGGGLTLGSGSGTSGNGQIKFFNGATEICFIDDQGLRASTDGVGVLGAAGTRFSNVFANRWRPDATVTAAGTTGAQTINKAAGSVNFAAAAASLVVTNNLVSTSSIIIATVGANDATMTGVEVVAAAGSFTIFANAAPTGETRVNWIVVQA